MNQHIITIITTRAGHCERSEANSNTPLRKQTMNPKPNTHIAPISTPGDHQ